MQKGKRDNYQKLQIQSPGDLSSEKETDQIQKRPSRSNLQVNKEESMNQRVLLKIFILKSMKL